MWSYHDEIMGFGFQGQCGHDGHVHGGEEKYSVGGSSCGKDGPFDMDHPLLLLTWLWDNVNYCSY